MNRSRRRNRIRHPHRPAALETLEPRQLLSAVVLATSPVALYNGPGVQGLVGTIGGISVPANDGLEATRVAVGWDDGTVSGGQAFGHPSATSGYTSTPEYDSQGRAIDVTYTPAPYNPNNPVDIYIDGGVHAVRNHLIHVYFWQLDPTGRKIISQANFTTTVAITQNSPGGLTFTGQARRSFSGKVATLPAGSFPNTLSSPQTSPVTIVSTPSEASLYTVTISWGDGATSNAALVKNTDGTWNVDGAHTYADPGTYRVTVSSSSQMTVPPGHQGPIVLTDSIMYRFLAADTAVITPTPPAIQTTALQTFTASLGSIHLPAGETPANTTVMIAWGDGASTKAILVANTSGGYTVMGSHTYSQAGIFSIEITANPGDLPGVIFGSPNDNQLRLFQTAVIAPPIAVPD
ncbi:MAG TPA: hypothetical protein VHQ47_13435 [Phycisphaerae bacterium]|nr:hypothetical protein [Phycisphaerae bacterium]